MAVGGINQDHPLGSQAAAFILDAIPVAPRPQNLPWFAPCHLALGQKCVRRLNGVTNRMTSRRMARPVVGAGWLGRPGAGATRRNDDRAQAEHDQQAIRSHPRLSRLPGRFLSLNRERIAPRLIARRDKTPGRSGLGRGRIDHLSDLGNAVGREAALFGVFTHQLRVGRDVDAIDLVVRDVALDPVDLRAELLQDAARFLGDGLQLCGREFSDAGNFAFDDLFGHRIWVGLVQRMNLGSGSSIMERGPILGCCSREGRTGDRSRSTDLNASPESFAALSNGA